MQLKILEQIHAVAQNVNLVMEFMKITVISVIFRNVLQIVIVNQKEEVAFAHAEKIENKQNLSRNIYIVILLIISNRS